MTENVILEKYIYIYIHKKLMEEYYKFITLIDNQLKKEKF